MFRALIDSANLDCNDMPLTRGTFPLAVDTLMLWNGTSSVLISRHWLAPLLALLLTLATPLRTWESTPLETPQRGHPIPNFDLPPVNGVVHSSKEWSNYSGG